MKQGMRKGALVSIGVVMLLSLFPLSALACTVSYDGDGGCAGFWLKMWTDSYATYNWRAELWQVGTPDTKVDSQSGSLVVSQYSQLREWIYVPLGADPNDGATWRDWNVTCDGSYYVKLHWDRQGSYNVWNSTGEAFTCQTPSAVTLASFTASAAGNAITLDWTTETELANLGFNLYRAESADGSRTQLNGSLIAAQAPGSAVGAGYQFVDTTAQQGITYYYWLEDVDMNGNSTFNGPVSAALSAVRRLQPTRPRLGGGSMGVRTR